MTVLFIAPGTQACPLVEYSSRVDNDNYSTEMNGSLSDGSLELTWTGTNDTYIAQYSGMLDYEAIYAGVQPAVGAMLDLSAHDVPYQILIDNPDGLEFAVVAYTTVEGEDPVFQLEEFGTATAAEFCGELAHGNCTGAFGVLLQGSHVDVDLEIQLRMGSAMPIDSATLDGVKALYR